MDSHFDFVKQFVDFGVPEIAEYILSLLDYEDLRCADHVCTLWRNVIENRKVWKRVLEKMLLNPTFKKLYDMSPEHFKEKKGDFRVACHRVLQHHQRLMYNWLTGTQWEDSTPVEGINALEGRVCFDMNDKYVVMGQFDGKIIVHNRDSATGELNSDQSFVLKGPMIGLCCLQLHTIQHILICGGTEGVIQIWDLQLRQLLFKRISQNEKGHITFLRSEHELLVMGSSKLQRGDHQSYLAIWKIGGSFQITKIGAHVSLAKNIYGLGIDKSHVVVLVGRDSLFEVQIRSAQNMSIIKHAIEFCSHEFCGFHYENGFVAAGSDDGKIRIWDVETGTHRRTLLRPSFDTGCVWFRFNNRFLVTRNRYGFSVWNFKEATNINLDPYTKLLCGSFQINSRTQPDKWHFHMDEFEIVRLEFPDISSYTINVLPGYRIPTQIVRQRFLSPTFY